MSWIRADSAARCPYLTVGRHFLNHFDAVGNRADDEAEAFHGPAGFAGEANHEGAFHHHG